MKFGPESLRWRLTLWYAALLAIPLILFAAGSRLYLERMLAQRADHFVRDARTSFITELATEYGERQSIASALEDALDDIYFSGITFLVYGGQNDSLLNTPKHSKGDSSVGPLDLAAIKAHMAAVRPASLADAVIADLDSHDRMLVGLIRLGSSDYTAVAIQSRTDIQTATSRFTVAFLVAVPLFLLLATLGGYLLARQALAPVAMMSRQARRISATTLHERLPVSGHHDELGELATLVNELLQRLERSFELQRRFVANASHELRTPIAILRAESEIALGREGRDEAEYRDSLRVVREAADRMSHLVNDLFTLARGDAGHMPTRNEPLYLDELVTDVARSMRGVAEQAGVTIEVAPLIDAPFVGDEELLGRMLLNLLDNAVKYSSRGSTIRLALTKLDDNYRITIADEGEGIPVEAQPHIFERFFRADKARSRSNATAVGGAGLGLAIVQLVAEAHGGRVALVRSGPGGSEFVVGLPAQRIEQGSPSVPLIPV